MTPREFRMTAGTVSFFAVIGLALVMRGFGAPTWFAALTAVIVGALLAVVIIEESRFL